MNSLCHTFLDKFKGLKAEDFDLVNNEGHFEELLRALTALADNKESMVEAVDSMWTHMLLKLFLSPNLQKRLFAIKVSRGFLLRCWTHQHPHKLDWCDVVLTGCLSIC